MTHLLLLDTEQAAIITDAAETSVRLLGYRLARADPDHVISASIRLQSLKIEQVKQQLALPALPSWPDMSEEQQAEILKAASLFIDPHHVDLRGLAFVKLFATILKTRSANASGTAEPDQNQAPVENVSAPKNA